MDAVLGFLTTKETSQRLGVVTALWVRQLVLQGSLQAGKAGRVLVLENSLNQFENAGRRERGRPKKILEK